MKTDLDQVTPSDNANRLVTDSPPCARGIAHKAVLAAVVIGIVTILALWVLAILQNDDPGVIALTTEPDHQVADESEAKGARGFRLEHRYDPVVRQGHAGQTQIALITS